MGLGRARDASEAPEAGEATWSTAARVLAALERAGAGRVSGESLARSLGVSRAAVWKAIASLRRGGCAIEALSGHGYRLVTIEDRLRPELVAPALTTRRFGQHLECYALLESTMDTATARARAGHPEGTVVVAETQTAGRGRRGRTWHSPAGLNLYLSLVLRPAIATHQVGPVTLVAGLALARAVTEVAGFAPGIKWPNDLYCGPRKLAGILTELSAELDQVHHVVVGVGLNVNAVVDDFPPELRELATSLRIEAGGRPFRRAHVLAAFLNHFEPAYDRFAAAGLEPFLPEIEATSAVRGRRVEVDLGARRFVGRALGVGPDGALTVELEDGERIALHSGEITAFAAEGASPC
ncbi:MAG: biotin--[acetyl-CoA-carboxylase] ligase [bacterium]